METNHIDGQCLSKNAYCKNSGKGYMFKVDVEYLHDSWNDLPILTERMKIKKCV